MAQSLFKALCTQNAQADISVLAPAATFPLLERMPEVKQGILSPIAHGKLDFSAHRAMGHSLRGQFDQAIVLPSSLKSALIPAFAKIPKRTAWKGELRYGLINDMRTLDEAQYPLMIEQYLALSVENFAPLPEKIFPHLHTNPENIEQVLQNLKLDTSKKILAFCPGAEYGPAKQWPATHFANLAVEKIQAGWQVWIFGGPKDVEISESIAKTVNSPHCISLAGKTKLLDAVDLLSLADTVVSNDSGLMHVSCALGKKVVVLYGSSTPAFTPPLSLTAKPLSLNLECSPCFQRTCPLGHLNCLNRLQAAQVSAAIEQLS